MSTKLKNWVIKRLGGFTEDEAIEWHSRLVEAYVPSVDRTELDKNAEMIAEAILEHEQKKKVLH